MADNRYNKRSMGKEPQRRGPISEKDVYRSAASGYRRKKFGGANMAVVLCSVLLISALAASVWHIATMERPRDTKQDMIEQSLNAEKGDVQTEEKAEAEFDTLTLTAADVHTGDLILVNYENEYVFPADESALVNVYQNKTENYSVAYNDYLLDGDVLSEFSGFMAELSDVTGDSCILVNSTYRSLESQQNIYDSYVQSNGEEYAKNYVADPGKSEHHTGLALDLTVRYADGTYVLMKNYENLETLNTLCVEYGFIQRYPDNKYYYTHINTEPWHYRYVGVPHAYVIAKKSFCLEEYITFMRDYTVDGEMLLLNETGDFATCDKTSLPENGYVLYYVPENVSGDTEVMIPDGCTDYTVSGNNCDGFVVAVLMGESELPEASFPTPSKEVQ